MDRRIFVRYMGEKIMRFQKKVDKIFEEMR